MLWQGRKDGPKGNLPISDLCPRQESLYGPSPQGSQPHASLYLLPSSSSGSGWHCGSQGRGEGGCPPISTDREAEAVKCQVMSTAKWQEQGCCYQLLRGALWTGQ